jgi:hypothetical protein
VNNPPSHERRGDFSKIIAIESSVATPYSNVMLLDFDAYRWEFTISHDFMMLESFSRDVSHLDVCVLIEEEDSRPPEFTVSSRHLDNITDGRQAVSRMQALLRLFHGALSIKASDLAPFRVTGLYDVATGHHVTGDMHETYSTDYFDQDLVSSQRKLEYLEKANGSSLGLWMYVARHDEITRSVLNFVGTNGLSWVTLYALLEFCKSAGWNDNKIASTGALQPGRTGWRKLFGQTSNSFEVLGPLSRHGPGAASAPKKPMTHAKAVEHVRRCTIELLKERARILATQMKAE